MSPYASLPGRTIFGVFFVVCLALFVIVPAGADVRILSSSGGAVEEYLRIFAQLRRSGERIIIDGPCFSACTLTKRPRVARTGGDAYRDPVLSSGSPCVDQEARRAYGETDLSPRTGARVLVSAVLSRHLRMDRYEPTGRCIELPGEFCKGV